MGTAEVATVQPVPRLLTENAFRHGEKLAFADDRRSVTWAELERRTARLAAGLGVRRGARVAFCLDDGVHLIEGLLATVRAAAIGVPLSPRGTDAELAALLADCDPSVLVTDRRQLPRLTRLTTGRSTRLLVTGEDTAPYTAVRRGDLGRTGDGALPDAVRLDDLGQTREGAGADAVRLDDRGQTGVAPDDVVRLDDLGAGETLRDDLGLDEPAWLLYTSGTTGTPRAAVFSQRSALWSPVACYQPGLGFSAADRLLWPLPLTHTYAHSLCVLGTTVAGASARITSAANPAALARLIGEYAPTILGGVPLTYQQLLDAGLGAVPSLRLCVTAGAPSDPDLRERVEARFGAPLLDGYGSTETCGKIAMETLDGPRVRGSSGPPLPGMDVRLVDPDTGREAAEGEIRVRGPGVMLGYHDQPDALPDGWYHTGDLGRLGEHGCLTVTGRVSDRIIRGGENVDPAEVEQVLRGLPGVRDAVVVGRAHPLLGEVPVAFVAAERELDPARLLRSCAEVLSAHKVPDEILFTPAVPRTAAGKPRRAVMREALAEHPADPALARLAGRTPAERRAALVELVCAETAAINGEAAEPGTAFADLGLSSMGAMTLWHRLSLNTGLRLPATLVWDHPNPAEVAAYLDTRLYGSAPATAVPRRGPAGEPVAIVAAACRYPGGVRSPEDLWRLVADGVDATGDFPADRGWDLAALYDPDPDHLGTSYARRGGFLYDAADFDPVFFGISPREALATDPQHRLLLEVAWEALERAGIPAPSVRGTSTGVYVGLMHGGYGGGAQGLESHIAIGSAGSVASGRISYVLGLRGPTMTVDTACSSSLVAMDLAASALRAGECTLALAGGVTVMASPRPFIAFSRQRGLSPDGRCRSFAAGADGTAWAEGVGLVLLEKLSDARRNGHPVLAVLRGSAVNADGASNGLTAPNGDAQRELIRLALADAGLRPAEVDVVEGHGTGTALGDPIEANAVLATYGQDRDPADPVWLGSVKSNLGHTQTAAGVAGVIKMIEAMRHGELPRSLYAEQPSPHVDWSTGAVRLLADARPWPARDRPRRAGISAFGIGGTNAHVIIEEPPETGSAPPRRPWPPAPWLISAGDEAGLRATAGRLAAMLAGQATLDVTSGGGEHALDAVSGGGVGALDVTSGGGEHALDAVGGGGVGALDVVGGGVDVRAAVSGGGVGALDGERALDVAYSLATTRASFPHRAAVLSADVGGLRALAEGADSPALVRGTVRNAPKVALLCAGQGSQRPGMGRDLAMAFPVFEATFTEVCEEFTPWLDRPLLEAVDDPGLVDRTDYAQPALFAFEVAVHTLLDECGVRPDYLVGHSIGELAAAHIAGVFSLADAVRLVAARGRLMAALPAGGAMVAVRAPLAEVAHLLGDRVAVSAVNGPDSVVLSGDEEAVTGLVARIGRPSTRLRVSHAFHSPLLDPMLAEFRAVAESVTYRRPYVPVVSTLTGRPEREALAAAGYWVRQARETVMFADAVGRLAEAGVKVFVEAGPSSSLSVLAEECVPQDAVCTPCPDAKGMLTALSTAHVHGVPVDWRSVYAGSGARRRPLPTYPFQRRRYWLDAARHQAKAGHPLLGEPRPDADGPGVRHTGVLSTARQPWLADHVIGDRVLVPATVFAELAFRAAGGGVRLTELTFREPLELSEPAEVQVVADTGHITIWARTTGPWTRHATATIAPAGPPPAGAMTWPPEGAEELPVDYAWLAGHGHHYGPAFRAVTGLWRRGADLFAELSLPGGEAVTAGSYTLHPALLDAALHAALLAEGPGEPRVPLACGGVTVYATGATAARAHLARLGPDEVRVTLTDLAGRPLATVDSLVTKAIRASASLHRVAWRPAAPGDAGTEHELFDVTRLDRPEDMPGRVRALVTATLERVRDWVAGDRPGRLVVLTRDATGDDPDPAEAAVAGLVRSVQSEHPDRIVLVDGPGATVETALRTGEPQVAFRDGTATVPRLTAADPPTGVPPDLAGTVLITGGTGALGASLARYLVAEHGVRHLLLVNRSGRVPGWVAGLPAQVVACDVGDRAAVDALVESCRPALKAVFHLAGVVADGVVDGMTPRRVTEVLAPKADGAWHLHEATKDLGLSAFVLYSSAAGVLGRPGQSNYASANGFLDALARHRVANGLPAQSLAWGPWSTAGDEGMAGRVDRRKLGDVQAVTEQEGVELLDAALRTPEAVLVPISLPGGPPVRTDPSPRRPAPATAVAAGQAPGSWRDRLAAVAAHERETVLAGLIRAEVAAVLGFPDAAAFPADRSFGELGFDSLTQLQVRNRLSAFTRVRLPATVVLDHPTLPALTAHVLAALHDTLPAADAEPPSYRFGAVFHRVLREQGPFEAMALRFLASYALPSFTMADRARHAVAPVRFAGGDGIALAFIPDYLTLYNRVPTGLAARFDGERDLFLLEHPGFGARRSVPDGVATLVRTHADTVRALERPVVVVGYCAGGAIAHDVARHLAGEGRPPVGVVLLDSHPGVLRRDDPRALALMAAGGDLPDDVADEFDDSLLIAGGGYARVLADWRGEPSPVPTLLVRGRPTAQMRHIDPGGDWQPYWPLPHDVADVPGDHYSIVHRDAEPTAEAIRSWLARMGDPR